ncbi:Uncharacterized protein SCF082_LOCUS31041, partial [Durusdinium trenchii]
MALGAARIPEEGALPALTPRGRIEGGAPRSDELGEKTNTSAPATAQAPEALPKLENVWVRPNTQSTTYLRQYIMSDLERWRQVFREEAQRCVQELRQTVEEGRGDVGMAEAGLGLGAELLSQLESGRRAEQAETERLRSHVEELLRLNSSLRQASLDQLSSKEIGKLKGCMVDLTREIQDLMGTKRQEHPMELAKVAADAASRALKQNREEVVKVLHSNLEAQQKVFEERWKSEDERWSVLDQEVARLRSQTKAIEEMSGQLWEEVGEQMIEKMATRLDAMMEEKLKSFSRTGGEAAQQRATSKAAA